MYNGDKRNLASCVPNSAQEKLRRKVVKALVKLSKISWAGQTMHFADTRWTRAVTDWIPQNVKNHNLHPSMHRSDFLE